jgi:hypothetical protein
MRASLAQFQLGSCFEQCWCALLAGERKMECPETFRRPLTSSSCPGFAQRSWAHRSRRRGAGIDIRAPRQRGAAILTAHPSSLRKPAGGFPSPPDPGFEVSPMRRRRTMPSLTTTLYRLRAPSLLEALQSHGSCPGIPLSTNRDRLCGPLSQHPL